MLNKYNILFLPLKSILLSLPILIKNIFDFFLGINPISSSSSIAFILLSLRYIIKNKWYLFCMLFFLPMLVTDFLSLRILLTISLFFIFFNFISQPNEILSDILFYLVLIISIGMVIGLFIPSYYVTTEYKYKFIYNDPNNFGPYASAYMAILMYFYFKFQNTLKKILIMTVILGVYFAISQLKGRLYGFIGTLEMFFFLYLIYKSNMSKKLFSVLLATFMYLFLGLLNNIHIEIPFIEFLNEHQNQNIDNITSLTGRDSLWKAFAEHVDDTSFSSLLYGSTYASYAPIVLKYTSDSTHSYVENSYFVTILFGGLLSLLVVLILQIRLLFLLYRFQGKLVIIFASLYYIVFFFDDSLIYPISIFHQLLSIYALFQMEINYDK